MASFAVVEEDQLMLVTNMGQVIRIRVHGAEGDSIRIAGRKTQGVRLFDVADDDSEKVVSAGLVREADSEDDEDLNTGNDGGNAHADMNNDGGSGDRTADNTNDSTDNETSE